MPVLPVTDATFESEVLAGGVGRFETVDAKTFETEFDAEHIGQFGATGHRADHSLNAMRREPPGEFIHKGLEAVTILEESIEIEPPFAVVTGFHPEVTAASGQEVKKVGRHGLPIWSEESRLAIGKATVRACAQSGLLETRRV